MQRSVKITNPAHFLHFPGDHFPRHMIDCGIAYGLIQSGSRHTAHALSSVNLQKFFFSIPTVVRGDRGTDFTSAGHIRIIAAILDHSAGNLRFPAHDIRHFRGVWNSFWGLNRYTVFYFSRQKHICRSLCSSGSTAAGCKSVPHTRYASFFPLYRPDLI